MLIDQGLLDEARPANGEWTAAQMKILKLPWPPPKAWEWFVIGNYLTMDEAFQLFEARDRANQKTRS